MKTFFASGFHCTRLRASSVQRSNRFQRTLTRPCMLPSSALRPMTTIFRPRPMEGRAKQGAALALTPRVLTSGLHFNLHQPSSSSLGLLLSRKNKHFSSSLNRSKTSSTIIVVFFVMGFFKKPPNFVQKILFITYVKLDKCIISIKGKQWMVVYDFWICLWVVFLFFSQRNQCFSLIVWVKKSKTFSSRNLI